MGSHVISRLRSAGYQVRAMVRDDSGEALVESLGATAVRGSVEREASWSVIGDVDSIVHAAALVTQQKSWGSFQAVNIQGTRYAAQTAALRGARFIHISSVAVYGRQVPVRHRVMREDTKWQPLRDADYYARSKREAELELLDIAQKTGLSWVALRPCVVYGERDRAFMPRVLRALRFGIAPLVGRGDNVLTVVYAGNVAEAVHAALEHPQVEGSFNVANDGDITQREFVSAVGAAMGRSMRFVKVPLSAAQGFAHTYYYVQRLLRPSKYPRMGVAAARFLAAENPYTSERARQELKWTPSVPPQEAITRSVHWFTGDKQ